MTTTPHLVDLIPEASVAPQPMYFSSNLGRTAGGNPVTFPNSTTGLQGYYNNGGTVTFSHVVVWIDATDSVNLFDFGIYAGSAGGSGTLLCDLASSGSGIHLTSASTFSCTQGTATLPDGPFWLGWTSNSGTATAKLDGLPSGNTFLCDTAPTSGNATMNGALNTSVGLPANSFSLNCTTQINFDLY